MIIWGFSLQNKSEQQGAGRLTCFHFSFLNQVIRKFRDEELEHHDIGLEHDAELVGTPVYLLFACGGTLFGRMRDGKVSVPRKIQSGCQTKRTNTLLDRKPANALLPAGNLISCFSSLSFYPALSPFQVRNGWVKCFGCSRGIPIFWIGFFFPPIKINCFLDLIAYPEKSQPCHARPVPYNWRWM